MNTGDDILIEMTTDVKKKKNIVDRGVSFIHNIFLQPLATHCSKRQRVLKVRYQKKEALQITPCARVVINTISHFYHLTL